MGKVERAHAREALLRDLESSDTDAERGRARYAARDALTTDPADLPLRMALAEEYRRMSQNAQAARWGIVPPGWSRKREIEELRRWLIGEQVDGRKLRTLLLIPHDASVPTEVEDLVPETARGPQPRERRYAGSWPFMLAAIGALFAAVTTSQAIIAIARGDLSATSGVVEHATRAGISVVLTVAFMVIGLALYRRDEAQHEQVTHRSRFTDAEEDALIDRLRESEPRAARVLERARARRPAAPPPSPSAEVFGRRLLWGFLIILAFGAAVSIAGALGLAMAVVAARVLLCVVVGSVLFTTARSLVKEARGATGAVDVAGWAFSLSLVVGIGLDLVWHFPVQGNWR